MGLRTKIVKLIDKYSQKRCKHVPFVTVGLQQLMASIADLVSMNETFVKARSIYERMMEQSLARLDGMKSILHSAVGFSSHILC